MVKGSRTISGGTKDFVITKDDIERIEKEDTDSTKEFKQALHLKRFYDGKATKEEIQKYVRFHNLRLNVRNRLNEPIKCKLDLGYEIAPGKFRRLKSIDIKGSYSEVLPENRYKALITMRKLLFFKKKQRKVIDLDQDLDHTMIV